MMHGPLPKKTAQQQIVDLAREHLETAKGNVTKAIHSLARHLQNEPHLLRELVAPVVIAASHRLAHLENHRKRAGLLTLSHVPTGNLTKAQVVHLARDLGRAFLDFPLTGGVKLKDATREQVVAQAKLYETHGNTELHRARWLAAIARKVPEGKKVGDVMTDADAGKLWEKTCNV